MSNLRSIAPELAKAIGGMNQLPRDSRMMDGMGQQPGMSDFAQKQMQALQQQMQGVPDKAMFKDSLQQQQALQQQMQGVPDKAMFKDSLQRAQALQQANMAQAQALPAQQRAMFAEQFQRAQGGMGQPQFTDLRAMQQAMGQQQMGQPQFTDLRAMQQAMGQQQMGQPQFTDLRAMQQAMGQAMGQQQMGQPQIPQQLQQMQGVPDFAQPYMQGLGAAAASRTGGMFQQPKRATPRSNPMTGLGAFSANPSIAAANPFAGLGVTAGAQQAQQTVQPPYNPGLDDSRMGDNFGRQPSGFGQPMGQLFGIGQAMGQPQTQQSPYAQQQASNLMQQQQYSLGQPQNFNPMQNAGQVGQGVYGSFVGQRQQPQPAMQQQTPQQQQNPAQAMQGSVAPPMQAGYNFFNQGQDQGGAGGGGATGGGGLF
jgi:hypothetical protein